MVWGCVVKLQEDVDLVCIGEDVVWRYCCDVGLIIMLGGGVLVCLWCCEVC